MGKKSKTKPKKKKNKLDNPYYCLGCNKPYLENQKDIGSRDIENYVRYLGYCHVDCWDKLPDSEKHEIAELAVLHGSVHKVKHKFYLLNIDGYI